MSNLGQAKLGGEMNTLNTEEKSSSSIMLPVVELVIAIGLFAIISIFIMRFFMSANKISREANDLSNAIIKAEDIIERGKQKSFEELHKNFSAKSEITKTQLSKNFEIYYDANWQQDDLNSEFVIKVTEKVNEDIKGIYDYEVEVYGIKNKREKLITKLSGSKYEKVD